MMRIPLGGKKAAGRVALIDDEDYALVSRYRWSVIQQTRPSGSVHGPYANACIYRSGGRQINIMMHNLILGSRGIDHRNGDGLDNRRSNLREAANGENQANTSSRGGTSSFKGVSWYRWNGKWRAAISINYRKRHLGYFDSEEAAARAYDAAALEAWGAYARLNFPEST